MRLVISALRYDPRLMPILVALIIGMQAALLVPDMFEKDIHPDFYHSVAPYLFICDPLEYPQRQIKDHPTETEPTRNPIKWWLNCASFQWFDNYKVLPLIFNIGIMPLTYLVGSVLAKDRMIGLLALTALILNPLYTDWVTDGTYDMTWAFFVLLSVYLMFRGNGKASLVSLVVAILTKSMVLLYFPAWLYPLRKNKKLIITVFGFGLLVVAVVLYFGLDRFLTGNVIGFFPENWEQAIFRNISLLWQVIPALIALVGINVTFHAKNTPKNKRIVIVWLLWILFTTPLIHLFTQQLTFSYRMVVFASFMSIFAGMVLVELGNFIVEAKLSRKHKKESSFIKD